mmetsp:Transcript_58207/g.126502  ORF Transcript_58207/g.126502 Transcript_58207/m.126502 type:complete len:329 (+) Transcript_58207:494-1480(+)
MSRAAATIVETSAPLPLPAPSCEARSASLPQEGCAAAARRMSFPEASAVCPAPASSQRSRSSRMASAASAFSAARGPADSSSSAFAASPPSWPSQAASATAAAQCRRAATGALARAALTTSLQVAPAARSCLHQSSHIATATSSETSSGAHSAPSATPGLRVATASRTSRAHCSMPSVDGTHSTAWARTAVAVARKAAQCCGFVSMRPSARRRSSRVGAKAFSVACVTSAFFSIPGSSASAPVFRAAKRWHATRDSRRRNSPQSFGERGAKRRPRSSSARDALMLPHFSSRSAARSQRRTSRGWNFRARVTTRLRTFVLPLRRQKSTY